MIRTVQESCFSIMSGKRSRWIWAGISGFCIVVIAAIAVLERSRREIPRELNVSMDAQGRAQIGGVTIGNTNVRDNAFRIMDNLDMKPKIVVPITMTNAQQASNFIQVLESMSRAGLSREKKPNPYE